MQAISVADPRPFRTILAVAVAALLLLLGVAGLRSYRDLEAARDRERDLRARIEATRAEIAVLERRLRRLEDEDPTLLERLAREELWLARPEDVVIVLPAEEAASPGPDGAGYRPPAARP